MTEFTAMKKEIAGTLANSPLKNELEHAKRVLKWFLAMKPRASDSMKIAAFRHDIDRAVTGITERDLEDLSKYDEFKKGHSKRSASILRAMMARHGYSEREIAKTVQMVELHEFGGDADSDALKDADSIAYLEYNIPFYLERNGKEKALHKIRFMYGRLSDEGKRIASKLRMKHAVKELFNEAMGRA